MKTTDIMRSAFLIVALFLSLGAFSQENVGINVDTPQYILDVRSLGIDLPANLQLATPAEEHFLRGFAGRDGDPKPFLTFHEDDTFRIATSLPDFGNFTERITLIPSGNVGIGITLPANKLHVHDPDIFELPPPFEGFYGNNNYVQITNGVSGTADSLGLRVGVNTAGQGRLTHPLALLLNAGPTNLDMYNEIGRAHV